MTAAYLAQLKAQMSGPVARTPRAAPSVPYPVIGQREGTKEQPGAKPCPVRWNEAGALFRQQHEGMFRIVVIGHESDTARVVAALTALNA